MSASCDLLITFRMFSSIRQGAAKVSACFTGLPHSLQVIRCVGFECKRFWIYDSCGSGSGRALWSFCSLGEFWVSRRWDVFKFAAGKAESDNWILRCSEPGIDGSCAFYLFILSICFFCGSTWLSVHCPLNPESLIGIYSVRDSNELRLLTLRLLAWSFFSSAFGFQRTFSVQVHLGFPN